MLPESVADPTGSRAMPFTASNCGFQHQPLAVRLVGVQPWLDLERPSTLPRSLRAQRQLFSEATYHRPEPCAVVSALGVVRGNRACAVLCARACGHPFEASDGL